MPAIDVVARLDRPLGQVAGRFDELRIVERHQRLQRRVRPLADHRARFAARRVEHVHRRRRRRPLPERVHAAAIERLARVLLVIARVAADHRHGFPHAGRLIRLHARAADLLRQQAARRQRVVANHLGIHAEPRAAREQPILADPSPASPS